MLDVRDLIDAGDATDTAKAARPARTDVAVDAETAAIARDTSTTKRNVGWHPDFARGASQETSALPSREGDVEAVVVAAAEDADEVGEEAPSREANREATADVATGETGAGTGETGAVIGTMAEP